MTGKISICGNRTKDRAIAAVIVAMLLAANPFATNVAQPASVEVASDAAIEVTKTHRPVRPSMAAVRAYVQARASRHGWSWSQWKAVVALVNLENADWRIDAKNRAGSSAFGLFQILRTPHDTPLHKQVDRFIKYIGERYDNDPVAALTHHKKHGWY